ncbi:hypothetical protein [Amylolactobacillus amylophilus]|uniref:hypothetical protein n=1 Tax=Amylolactobacillus amylophilus TaxID=1603 RepID=UPI0006D10632|nr:hypothetical protein [Amylolactobacillus amylophilus]
MANLYKNELRKLVAKKSSWIMLLVALLFETLILVAQVVTDKSLTTGKLLMAGGPSIGGTFVLIFFNRDDGNYRDGGISTKHGQAAANAAIYTLTSIVC